MKTSERPTRNRVIKARRNPVRSAVAHLALLREPCRDVIRVVRPLEIFKVATHARRVRDVVVSIDVALGTLHLDVSSGQSEAGFGMIEIRRLPRRRIVTDLTLLGDTGRYVVGIVGSLIVL